MSSHVEFLYNTICCNPYLLIVDCLVAIHFMGHWFFSWKQTGWKIDLWHFTLFYSFFITVMLMYPFQASVFHIHSVGEDFFHVRKFVDKAFLITLLGYGFIWMGRYVYNFFSPRCYLEGVILLFSPMQRVIEKNLRSSAVFFLLCGATLFLGIFVIYYQIMENAIFSPRSVFLANHSLRPIYNLSISIISVALIFATMRLVKSSHLKKGYIVLLLFSFFWGLREIVIYALLNVFLYKSYANRGKIRFFSAIFLLLGMLILGIYIENMREGNFNPIHIVDTIFFRVIYGNHFSDTRDFAWVLSFWDHDLFWGKSYIAKILSFIPRKISAFRETWDMGLYTTSVVGLDASTHAGLRIGWFGEAFFNFGYVGVSLCGFILGYFLRYADDRIKKILSQKGDIIEAYSSTMVYMFAAAILINGAMWSFYVFVLVNIFLYPFTKCSFSSDRYLTSLKMQKISK